MSRPRIAFDASRDDAHRVRLWLLQLGAEPVDRAGAGASGLPELPQRNAMTRAEVAAFLAALTGAPGRAQRFDDHGSRESWPRGSF